MKPTPPNDPAPAAQPDNSAVRPTHSRKSLVAILLLLPLAGLAIWAVSRETGHPGQAGGKSATAGAGQAEDDTVNLAFKSLEFDPGPEWAGKHVTAKDPVKLPDKILALDGKRVRITGFLVPVSNVGGQIREFFITSSQTSCCFGTAPRIFDFILAKMPVGPDISYVGEPTVFEGVLHVQKPPAGDEWTPIFTMDCTDVYR